MRSARAARVLRGVLMVESDMLEPDDDFEVDMLESVELGLLVPEPLLLGLIEDEPVLLPDDVDGAVIVLASVERPVLGVAGMAGVVAPVLGRVVLDPVEPVGAAEPGFTVPVVDGVVAVGLVDDGLVLASVDVLLPDEVCACAIPTAPISAAMEAAAVRDLDNLIILWTPVRTVE